MPRGNRDIDLLRGTLDVLILKTLTWGPRHGSAVTRWIRSEWGLSENNRRAKYYELTAAGRRQLAVQAETWTLYAEAVFAVLRAV